MCGIVAAYYIKNLAVRIPAERQPETVTVLPDSAGVAMVVDKESFYSELIPTKNSNTLLAV